MKKNSIVSGPVKQDTELIAVRVPLPLLDSFRKICTKNDVNLSEGLRNIIQYAVRQEETK